MLGRQAAADEEGRQGVQRIIQPQQPAHSRASAHRRLIDRGREASRCHRGQHAREPRPGDVQELARLAPLAGHLDQPSEARKRPVQRAPQDGAVGGLIGERSAAEGIGAVQQPYARPAQGPGNGVDFADQGRSRAAQPPARQGIGQACQQAAERQPAQAGRPQGQRLFAALPGMGWWAAVAQVDDRYRFHEVSDYSLLSKSQARRRCQVMRPRS
jgi:hypothetical protein